MAIKIVSYGCKNGEYDDTNCVIIPCHDIPNPHKNPVLREKDGRDPDVQVFVLRTSPARDLLEFAKRSVARTLHPTSNSNELTIAFQCIGGRHRSVAMAETLYSDLTDRGIDATVSHRDID